MIEFTKSFKCSDGTIVATLREAQILELSILLHKPTCSSPADCLAAVSPPPVEQQWNGNDKDYAERIVEKIDAILDILTTTPTSKPKARKINGGTKKRKTVETPAS